MQYHPPLVFTDYIEIVAAALIIGGKFKHFHRESKKQVILNNGHFHHRGIRDDYIALKQEV